MTPEFKSILFRFTLIIILVVIICTAIIGRASKTIFIEAKYWQQKADSLRTTNLTIQPERGNIFADDMRLMASSVPQYYTYIDFWSEGLTRDSLMNNIDKLSNLLANKFQDRTPAGYRDYILRGYKERGTSKRKRNRQYLLVKRKVSYIELKEMKTYPLFKHGPNKSGFYNRQMVQRVKPFGTLASRTIGDIYGEYEKGGSKGLEMAYDSLLRGTSGSSVLMKVRGTWARIPTQDPIPGNDIRSTIDIEIQDITESSLLNKLREVDAASGTAVVMEVATGEVKAITNFARGAKGDYYEARNAAVADEIEPGSTFKVISMMVALDAGVVRPDDPIDTGSGVWYYGGQPVNDHNKHKGGYGVITAAQSIWYSSNIGIAKIIVKGFEKNPADYVNRIYNIGLTKPIKLDIPGSGRVKIKHPSDKDNWWKTSLAWMSFGYETQIPPIYILMYYNAIANNGVMMRPLFATAVLRNGEEIERFAPEVINPSICKSSTLIEIKQMLLDVVEKGTASAVKSPYLKIAGKTGTAQIAQGGSYGKNSGEVNHQVSFCGYFPANDPKYSCIVVIRYPRIGYPSGGSMSGGVFRAIAENINARNFNIPIDSIHRDSLLLINPIVKRGSYLSMVGVASTLKLPFTPLADGAEWVSVATDQQLHPQKLTFQTGRVPSVIGMGARDALFLLETEGLTVRLSGKGSVIGQSITPGTTLVPGSTIIIQLGD